MITQKTAGRLWNCYREIAAGEQLLADMQRTAEEYRDDVRAESLKDAFGHQRCLQLGVPSSPSSNRLLDVDPSLGKVIIEAHIAKKRSELVALNDLAKQEASLDPE